jgi:hypothetical protein
VSGWTPACNCGAYCEDECSCCPSCYTPQGDERIPTNGCNDPHGCGLNRDMDPSIEAKDQGMDKYELAFQGRCILKNGKPYIDIRRPAGSVCEVAEADELATKLTMDLNGAAYLVRLNMVRANIEKRRLLKP